MRSRRPYSQQYLDEKDPSEVSLLPQAPELGPGCNNKKTLKFDNKEYIFIYEIHTNMFKISYCNEGKQKTNYKKL